MSGEARKVVNEADLVEREERRRKGCTKTRMRRAKRVQRAMRMERRAQGPERKS